MTCPEESTDDYINSTSKKKKKKRESEDAIAIYTKSKSA